MPKGPVIDVMNFNAQLEGIFSQAVRAATQQFLLDSFGGKLFYEIEGLLLAASEAASKIDMSYQQSVAL